MIGSSKALLDHKQIDQQGDDYVATPEDVFHYQQVEQAFFAALKPVSERHWAAFALIGREVLEKERVRARQHYEKMRKHFAL